MSDLPTGTITLLFSDGEEPRFKMLETIREYGLERLAESEEAEATLHAYASYYLALVEGAEPQSL